MAAPTTTTVAAHVPVKPSALADWINHLRILMPPEGLVHVGAGNGADLPDYAAWGMSQVVLIEADEAKAKRLSALARPHAGWQVHHALVAETDGDATFHVASNPRESGLIPAEALRPLWRNLQARAERTSPGVRLDHLIPAGTAPDINWLTIDCLPAAALVKGAQHLLKQCDVVLGRASLLNGEGVAQVPGSTLNELTQLLADHGFRQLAIEEERMPMLGMALYARLAAYNKKASAAELHHAHVKIEALNLERVGILSALEQAHTVKSEQQQILKKSEEEVEYLKTRLATLEALQRQLSLKEECQAAELKTLSRQLSESVAECDRLRSVIEEYSAKLDQMQAYALQHDEVSRQAERIEEMQAVLNDRQGQIDQIDQARIAAEALVASTHNHAHMLAIECDKLNEKIRSQTVQLAEKDGQLARANLEMTNQAHLLAECREQMKYSAAARKHFDIEIAKAEAQIALISDVLLRQDGTLSHGPHD